MSRSPLYTALTTIPVFTRLSPAALDTLAVSATEARFLPGTQVITKGEAPGALMLLVAGRLKVAAGSIDGRELTFRIVEPVEIVGEVALLDGQPRTADVVALNTSTVLLLPRAAVLAALERHPDFALGMIRLLCARLRDTSQGLESIAMQRVPARLAATLLRLAAEYGRPASDGGILLPMRLSQTDLSTMVAATREAVNKQLAQWREAGVLRMKAGQIVLLRPEALRQTD